MRRRGNRSGALAETAQGEQGFWPSYADMMSAVALILFFLMLLSYIQNLITGNTLKATQDELSSTKVSLTETQDTLFSTQETLDTTKEDLYSTQDLLAATQQDVEAAQARLQAIQAELEASRQALETQSLQLHEQDARLAAQAQLIAEQEAYVRSAGQELSAMRSQMQTIAVLRLSILEKIRDAMVEVMGDGSRVSIGDNGSILLDESILFDVGSYDIKPDAGPALQQLITVFTQFLAKDENTRYVDTIVISGHTDSTGSDESNRKLSTARANSVLNYLMARSGGALSRYASYFSAAGYGESRPVATNDTVEGRAANRRIEISIILRDDSVMDIVEQYLDMEVPGVTVVPAEP